jgi:undecaprenyl-diphosphatase
VHDYLISVLLGIVEGVTEFLPVSSTAHLRMAEALLQVSLTSGYWKMYTIVIQLGAILCLPIYFRARIATLWASYPRGARGDRTWFTHPLSLALLAFTVTAGPGLLFTKFIGKQLERPAAIGTALLLGGILMWVVDVLNARGEAAGPTAQGRIRTWSMDRMSPWQALWIGACQVLSAVFPGTSRSMITIAAGQVAGMSRASALEFSFFLSMPTMTAAVAYDLYKSSTSAGADTIGTAPMDPHGWGVLAVGLGVSFVVAYAAVAWFMAYVTKHGFVPFAVYRIAVGAAVLALMTA